MKDNHKRSNTQASQLPWKLFLYTSDSSWILLGQIITTPPYHSPPHALDPCYWEVSAQGSLYNGPDIKTSSPRATTGVACGSASHSARTLWWDIQPRRAPAPSGSPDCSLLYCWWHINDKSKNNADTSQQRHRGGKSQSPLDVSATCELKTITDNSGCKHSASPVYGH